MRLHHKEKKIMALVLVPLSFTLGCYLVLALLLSPVLDPLFSIYSLVTSDSVVSEDSEDLYANKLVPSETIKASDIKQPKYGDLFAKINIDKVNFHANLYYGDGTLQLRSGVGLYTGSFLPGFNRTSLIAGHCVPYFECLGDVASGDSISVSTHYGDFEYKITETKILQADDPSAFDLQQTEKEQLILYTCYPFELIGYKSQRLFVYADKVSGPTILEGQ